MCRTSCRPKSSIAGGGFFRGMAGLAAGFLGAGLLVMVESSSCCIRRQFGNDRPALALTRCAPGKVAGQFRCEGFSAGEDRACSGRVPRLLASPVPCRSTDAFGKPRLFRGPSWSDAARPAPPLRSQAVFLAALCICLFRTKHFCSSQGQKSPPVLELRPRRGPNIPPVAKSRRAGA
jgi:hypothetical protein